MRITPAYVTVGCAASTTPMHAVTLGRMVLAALAIVVSLVILTWSADRFVLGAAAVARHLGMAPLLVGMIIIGFGTSAPEVVISVFAAAEGAPEIALGTAFGSNVVNIGLVLGVTALVTPIVVRRGIRRSHMPVLIAVTGIAWLLMMDGDLSLVDACLLMVLLVGLTAAMVLQARHRGLSPAPDPAVPEAPVIGAGAAWMWLGVGLVVMVAASRLLVWGAVEIAQALGWSDLVIGLTVVAVGTSAPELASAIIAVRKGLGDLALGNIIGSNLFNTLAVVGVAGLIHPATVSAELLQRDLPMVMLVTVLLVVFGYRIKRDGRINRVEGAAFVALWAGYTALLLTTA